MNLLGLTEQMAGFVIRPSRSQYDMSDLGTFPLIQDKRFLNLKESNTFEQISQWKKAISPTTTKNWKVPSICKGTEEWKSLECCCSTSTGTAPVG